MKILGLDPANACGWAYSFGEKNSHGLWQLKLKSDKHPGRRLERFRRMLFTALREFGFDAIAFEDASFGSINPNTAASHNELAGVIKMFAAEVEIPVEAYKPTTLKKWLTGNGRAKKPEIIRSVGIQFGITTDDDNIADAIMVMEYAKLNFGKRVK